MPHSAKALRMEDFDNTDHQVIDICYLVLASSFVGGAFCFIFPF